MEAERQHYGVTLALLTVAGISFAVMQTLVVPALPFFQREFDTTATSVTWIATGFLLSSSVLTPILGKLGDSYGKKRMLVISLGDLRARLARRRGRLEPRVADRLPRHPGRRRRGLPAVVRDHPRRVPAREDRPRDRHRQLGVRRRRRRRARAERRDHRAPDLALAVPDRRRARARLDRAARHVRPRVAGQDAGEARLPRRPRALGRARLAAAGDQRGRALGLDVGRRPGAVRRSPR